MRFLTQNGAPPYKYYEIAVKVLKKKGKKQEVNFPWTGFKTSGVMSNAL